MVKKCLKFYLTTIVCSVIYYFTVGGVIGWFVTEGDTPIAALAVSILSYIAMLVGTSFLIKYIFKNYEFEKFDILKFLLPYLVTLCIHSIVLILNLSGLLGSLGEFALFVLTFFLPCAYSTVIIADFTYFVSAIIFSAIHILLIVLVLSSMKKRKEQ